MSTQLLEIIQKQVVGESGFEPPASWSRTKRATRLRYSPILFKNDLPARRPTADIHHPRIMLLKYRVAKLTLLKYKIPVKLSSLFASPQESCLRGWIMLELFCRFWIRKNHPFNAIIPVMFLR